MKKKSIKIGMKPPHPGAFIKTEVIDELGLSVTKAAEVLGVRRATLSELVNEKAALSPEMALRLEKAFHLDMDMLLRMQAGFDASEMRKQAGKIKISPHVPA
jgi:addiction module HigA family antidote